jgi:hypothetical protein
MAVTVAAIFATPGLARAQADREDLVNRGIDQYLDFQPDSAIAYLMAAVDPNIAAPDDMLKRGVQFLAQTLLSEGEEDLANLWMRWAVRHFGEMQIDSAEFDDPESIGNAYYSAMGFVGASTADDSIAQTTWEWPEFGVPENSGTMRLVQEGLTPVVTVAIRGRGTLQPGESISLAPGSYVVSASATGFEGVEVTREVLPGVTSVLGFDLVSIVVEEVAVAPDVLPEDVETRVRGGLARFTAARFGTGPTCGTGVFVGGDGLLLTTYTAIRGAEDLEVTLQNGTRVDRDIGVAAWDTHSNVALLKLPVQNSDSLEFTTDVSDGQWGWSFAHPQCASPAATRLQVQSWTGRPRGSLELADTVSFAEQGGPIVNQDGAVIGLGLRPLQAVPADHVNQILADARDNIENNRLTSVASVAARENHLYGSVRIQSTLTNARARVAPLEDWQWPETAASNLVPFTFTGPQGRYRLELQGEGAPVHQAEFTIDPGLLKEVHEPQIAAGGGGKFPWPIALLGAAGAAVAGVLFLGGGDDPTPETPDERGSVLVILPHRR